MLFVYNTKQLATRSLTAMFGDRYVAPQLAQVECGTAQEARDRQVNRGEHVAALR